jgi:thiamine biosynthesis lipoprotein
MADLLGLVRVYDGLNLNESYYHLQLEKRLGPRELADVIISRRLRPMLGTFVSVECSAVDAASGVRAAERAFEAVARVAELMHPRRADGAAINAARAGALVLVDPWTWAVLLLCRRLFEITDGSFDPCLPEAPGRFADLHLAAPGQVVCTRRVALDLGGIAKGYAVDCAVAALQAQGCLQGTVNAGGDLRTFGTAPVPVWVRGSAGAQSITLVNRACAVSDPAARDRPAEHRGYYNRVSAQCGAAVEREPPAVVLAPTAALADGLTKCVLIARAQQNMSALQGWLAHFDARVLG